MCRGKKSEEEKRKRGKWQRGKSRRGKRRRGKGEEEKVGEEEQGTEEEEQKIGRIKENDDVERKRERVTVQQRMEGVVCRVGENLSHSIKSFGI